jgi:hypothetical protein
MPQPCCPRGRCRWRYSGIENVVIVPALLDASLSGVSLVSAVFNLGVVTYGIEVRSSGSISFALALAVAVVGIVAVHKPADSPVKQKLALAYYIGILVGHFSATGSYAVASFLAAPEDGTAIIYYVLAASFWVRSVVLLIVCVTTTPLPPLPLLPILSTAGVWTPPFDCVVCWRSRSHCPMCRVGTPSNLETRTCAQPCSAMPAWVLLGPATAHGCRSSLSSNGGGGGGRRPRRRHRRCYRRRRGQLVTGGLFGFWARAYYMRSQLQLAEAEVEEASYDSML